MVKIKSGLRQILMNYKGVRKMKKDKMKAIRINSVLAEMLKKDGMSVQKIVDQYLEKFYKTKVVRRKK